MEAISGVYNTKNGPKTEPCGTPQINECENVVVPDKWTSRVLPVMYDSNRLRTIALCRTNVAVAVKEYYDPSNVAVRSNNMSKAILLVSSASIMSENTLGWPFRWSDAICRKDDWNGGNKVCRGQI